MMVRLPPRRVYPRRARMPRLHSQRPSQLVSHLLRQLIPSPTRVSPVPAFRLAGGSTAIPRHLAVILRRLPSPGPLSPWFSSRRDGATLGSPGSVPVRAVTATLAAGWRRCGGGGGYGGGTGGNNESCGAPGGGGPLTRRPSQPRFHSSVVYRTPRGPSPHFPTRREVVGLRTRRRPRLPSLGVACSHGAGAHLSAR